MSLIGAHILKKKGDKCPACNSHDKNPKNGALVVKRKLGRIILQCSRYPLCKYETKGIKVHKRL